MGELGWSCWWDAPPSYESLPEALTHTTSKESSAMLFIEVVFCREADWKMLPEGGEEGGNENVFTRGQLSENGKLHLFGKVLENRGCESRTSSMLST